MNTQNSGEQKNSQPGLRLPWKRILIWSLAAVLAALLLFIGLIWYLIASAPDIDTITVSPTESATYICDQDGNYLRKLTLASSNRDIITLEEMPDNLQNAIIAIEDERFYEHGGIDIRGIARAVWTGITTGSFSEGASTITQQLIKNSVFTEWTQENSFKDRFSRKIQEQYLALQLEDRISKEEILEDYLNTINLGSGCYGVQSAARRYYGKDAEGLSLAECAVLAAIPQNPSRYNPIANPEENRTRQQIILQYMQEQGYITQAEKDEAMKEDVYAKISAFNETYDDSAVYSYYEDALIDQVIDALQEEAGYSSDQAYRAVYSGGLRIFSAQDAAIQQICDEEFANPANFPEGTEFGIDYALSVSDEEGAVTHYGSESLRSYIRQTQDESFDLICMSEDEAQTYADAFRGHILQDGEDRFTVLGERLTLSPQPQASVVIIDQKTGYVRAIVGGRGEKTASLTLNRATETMRQPGSTFKILTAYAPALDSFGQTLATTYENEKYNYENGTPVSNWDITDYSGTVTVREAITRSINVVAVKCITEISPRTGFDYAEKFGISTLHESYETPEGTSSDIIQPLALGGITQGVTNMELCNAYAAISNGGIYQTPKFYTKVLDRYGNVLLDHTDDQEEPVQVLSEDTAFLLTDAMQDVVSSPSGTAYGSIQAAGQPVAGKTGTTSDYKDIWFVGYTPYYTCCVWGGYDNNRSLPYGSTYHSYNKVLWTSVMNRIHTGLKPAEFEQPDSVVSEVLCSQSHQTAVPGGCPETYTEYFAKGTQPKQECQLHEPVPETEPILIYPDIFDELVTESETESESSGSGPQEEQTSSEDQSASDDPSEPAVPPDPDESLPQVPPGAEETLPEQSESENPPQNNGGQPDTSSLNDLLDRLTGIAGQ